MSSVSVETVPPVHASAIDVPTAAAAKTAGGSRKKINVMTGAQII